jgi:hypothetical protein
MVRFYSLDQHRIDARRLVFTPPEPIIDEGLSRPGSVDRSLDLLKTTDTPYFAL